MEHNEDEIDTMSDCSGQESVENDMDDQYNCCSQKQVNNGTMTDYTMDDLYQHVVDNVVVCYAVAMSKWI